MLNVDFEKLNTILKSGTKEELDQFLLSNDLEIRNNKIYPKDENENKETIRYWDKRQLVKKIVLNSLYGGLLNPHCRFNDKRLGQSTTLCGRRITRHMASHINKIITGEYNHLGKSIIYGDSVTGDTVIRLSDGTNISIEELFNKIQYKVITDGYKEYAIPTNNSDNIQVLGYNSQNDEAIYKNISYVMRHKTNKKKYKIISESRKEIIVTEDHSLIVDRNGFTVEVKPNEILEDDLLITHEKEKSLREKIKSIQLLDDEITDVYDISVISDDHFFFGNDILLHNTDSSYFSAYPILKDSIKNNEIEWTKESIIELYDSIAENVNNSFTNFMQKDFNCPTQLGQIIKCGREIVATKGLFITKKRYAVLIYDLDGRRQDINGEQGYLKAMGMDLKRSDTPEFMQQFLIEILQDVLTGHSEEDILEKIKYFKQQFREFMPWAMGTPKRVNNLTLYGNKEKTKGKITMPGHVRAALNWNTLRQMNSDNYSMTIVDGQKTIVCKLKDNPLGYKSVAYPIDQPHLPDWFKELPFDTDLMEETIVDKKIKNLLSTLDWDLAQTTIKNTFEDLFEIS